MSLERISEQKVLINQSGQEEEEDAAVSFQASASRLISKRTQNQIRQAGNRHSIKIKLPQYERFSRYGISRYGGLGRFESLVEREETEIEISPLFAWLLLLMNIIAASLVPCWLMSNLSKQPHTRNSWRFLVITILTLPMVAYEKRRIETVGGNIFQLITGDLIRQNYIMAVNFSIEYWFIIQAINMTSLNHAVTFIGLKFYIISLLKYYKKRQHHEFVKAGLILVTLAVALMMGDSFLNTNYADASPTIPQNKYLRLAGDIFSLAGSVVSAFLYEEYQFPAEPRFLNLFFQNLFICFNYICFGYYFGGSELSFNEYYGVFGLFDSSNFVTIFYVGIMLGMNLILSNIMLYEIYSPFILQIANSFVPLVSALLYRILELELVPAYTYLGYGFLVPGMILILSGENASKEGEVRMNFIVYKPENAATSSRQQRNTPIQMEDVSKHRKISLEASSNKHEPADKEQSNMSI